MWNGLQMARAFYEECGKPMIESQFSLYADRIAVGLAGQGSECFGYDDRISRDHDYQPGFCLWLSEDLKQQIGGQLQQAYDRLDVEGFIIRHRLDMGMAPNESEMTGAREHRVGVHGIEEFFYEHTGITGKPQSTDDWLKTPMYYLAEAVNGEVFYDPEGEFSGIRSCWQNFYPEDILKKKVAADLAMAGKTGQFNYERSLRRGDMQAAYGCVTEFIYKVSAALFLLNGRYMPYYKWRGRAMKELTVCRDAVDLIFELQQLPESENVHKSYLIEKISSIIIDEIRRRQWSAGYSDYLLDQARIIMKGISDPEIASWNIFVGED
ncbi:MAG: DUF4037 domain-containing protein [Erysipelotrichaceae bacterium]|nr:DUF4037 domain-containing protein [Erysipelotrichaceae bacterium]